jgi:hypothetical protein
LILLDFFVILGDRKNLTVKWRRVRMKKNTLKRVFAVAFLFICVSLRAQFTGGTGTELDPYRVSGAPDLNEVRNYPSAYFIQTADINLGVAPWNSGTGWQPIGTSSAPFTGHYNGNIYSVNGLTINQTAGQNQGLFGYLSGAEISNVTVTGCSISGSSNVGALVGYANGGSITDCNSSGTVSGSGLIGGLIGSIQSATVTSSGSSASVTCTQEWGGGFAGRANSSDITRCFSVGSVSGQFATGGFLGAFYYGLISECYSSSIVSSATDSFIGGFIGETDGGVIELSYSTGSATGRYDVGGFIGYSYATDISDCYSTASATGYAFSGGFIGEAYGGSADNCYSTGVVISTTGEDGGLTAYHNGTVTSCYWDIETSNLTDSYAGEGKTTAGMNTKLTFSGWDFITPVWDIHSSLNGGYPYLEWQGLIKPFSAPENVVIINSGTDITVSWDEVTGATFYRVFGSSDPYGTYSDVSSSGTFSGASWSTGVAESKKFYYITAVQE